MERRNPCLGVHGGGAYNTDYQVHAFGTSGITADVLYPLVWKAVNHVEVTIGLKLISL